MTTRNKICFVYKMHLFTDYHYGKSSMLKAGLVAAVAVIYLGPAWSQVGPQAQQDGPPVPSYNSLG